MLDTNSRYARPSPREELGGELGLTSEQIAESLEAEHHHVRQAILDLDEEDVEFHREAEKLQVSKIGRPKQVLVVSADDAKMIVARYRNKHGRGYLRFLIKCEKVALESVPQLLKEISRLNAENHDLRSRLPQKNMKQLQAPTRKGMACVPVEQINLFGEVVVTGWQWVEESRVPEHRRLRAQARLLALQSEGAIHRSNELHERADRMPRALP